MAGLFRVVRGGKSVKAAAERVRGVIDGLVSDRVTGVAFVTLMSDDTVDIFCGLGRHSNYTEALRKDGPEMVKALRLLAQNLEDSIPRSLSMRSIGTGDATHMEQSENSE